MKANNYSDYRWTTNRTYYNRLRKDALAHETGMCSFCKYNRGENRKEKWYSDDTADASAWRPFGYRPGSFQLKYRRPSWKLASKNAKQWMDWTWQGNVNLGNREFSRISKNKRYGG